MFAPTAACNLPASGRPLFQGHSMAKPAVVVVGADKGGVGKTTVSRTLLDYFSANNVPTRAFDTEHPRGTLKRFHPEITEIVDMNSTPDQMKIFDTLSAVAPSRSEEHTSELQSQFHLVCRLLLEKKKTLPRKT